MENEILKKMEEQDFPRWICMGIKCINRKCKGCQFMELEVNYDENHKENDIRCVHYELCMRFINAGKDPYYKRG